MASVEAKPRAGPRGRRSRDSGVFEVPPGRETEYLHPLPVRRLWGVGPATHERLGRLGVSTDRRPRRRLARRAPRCRRHRPAATRLLELARGIDERPVESERPVKSVSHEETFALDLHGRDDLRSELARLADGVAARLRADGIAARTISLKVRDASVPHDHPGRAPCPGRSTRRSAIAETAYALLDKAAPSGGVRLLGVAASKFAEPARAATTRGIGRRAGTTTERRQQGDRPRARPIRRRRRSVRRAPCRRPGCGSCVAGSTSGAPMTPNDGGKQSPPRIEDRCTNV